MIAVRLFTTSILAVLSVSAFAAEKRTDLPTPARGNDRLLYSTGTHDALAARETAGPDTFALYGGPDAGLEGKFETAGGLPDFQGWTSVDVTEKPAAWQVSTFMADNLNGNGPGNLAYWCGRDAGQEPGWTTAPGYGNGWVQELVWESGPVADTSAWETVSLDFFFNTDLETEYDFLEVAYHFAGNWVTVFQIDGKHENIQYSTLDTLTAQPIRYEPNSYAGDDNDRIQLRIRVVTDVIVSDEDGQFESDGAAQIDDISIAWSGGAEFEDFEGPGPYLFEAIRQPFAGDFADVLTLLTDPDACHDNLSPAVAFIDYGQAPRNGPGANGVVSTGGATSPNVSYGIPGYYTVNGAGGLEATSDEIGVWNYVVSPEIPWNLPGPDDDGEDMVGAILRFDVWDHLPVNNFIFRTFDVRTRTAGDTWGRWKAWSGDFYNQTAVWRTASYPIGQMLVEDGVPDLIQVRLGAWDVGPIYGFTGNHDATPAPLYDNVAILKHRVGGPLIQMIERHLANDAFPRAPVFDVSTRAARDEQDVAFDMAVDINSGDVSIVPGDSIVYTARNLIPGGNAVFNLVHWALKKNPAFEDEIRTLPSRPEDINVVAGAEVWSGEILVPDTTFQDLYWFDLPDTDFLYPGDVLHYYISASDWGGRTTTLPRDTTGFLDFSETSEFDRDFIVRALPSVHQGTDEQPETLVIYDAEPGHEMEVILAFGELGYTEGVDFDVYRVIAAGSEQSNGIGSFEGHGASIDHLAGYENILYLSGVLDRSLSRGSNIYYGSDKSDDKSLVSAWSILPGTRRIAYFGDNILMHGGDPDWWANQTGAQHIRNDVAPYISGQVSPAVAPVDPAFYTEFVADGMADCSAPAQFDYILPTGLGYRAWAFLQPSGVPAQQAAAGVVKERVNGLDAVFPIAFHRIVDAAGRSFPPSARASLLQELFGFWSYCLTHPCTDTPPVLIPAELSTSPNPFNPTTLVKFTAAPGSKGTVKVYNLRGELVRTLHSGEFTKQEFRWDGTDQRGARVASGVYMIRATDGSVTKTKKVALVK